MGYNLRFALFSFMLVVSLSCTLHAAESRTGSREKPTVAGETRYVTVDTIRQSLPSVPIIAGFDIDDTVIFSSPGFYFGANNTDGPGGKSRYGDDYLRNPQFWRDLNQFHDRYSMKKKSGDELVRMHAARGDSIVFITKRFCYDDDADVLRKRLNTMFNVQSKVFCTDEQTKTPVIAATGVDVYYGDSDTDIEYAGAVTTKHVRPIRVLRSPFSTYSRKTGYNPGMLGEEVLVDSEN